MEIPAPCRIAAPLSRNEFEMQRQRLEIMRVQFGPEHAAFTNLADAYGARERDRRLIREWCEQNGFVKN